MTVDPQDPSVLKVLRSIYALLIDPGSTEGERQAAQNRLDHLLKKYDLTLDQIIEQKEKKVTVKFDFDSPFEQTLLFQILFMVLDVGTISYGDRSWREGYTRKSRKYIWIELSSLQYVEVSSLYSHYRKALKRDLDEFVSAFIYQNHLVRDHAEDHEMSKEELERLHRVIQKMKGIQPTPRPVKRLKSGA